MSLSDRDRALLDFEGRWTAHSGAKEEAIRTELSLTPARYYQLLARLVETADAVAYDPILVHRLRRISDAQERMRYERARPLSGAPHAQVAPNASR
ncbi:DUF3263 domain-containing protein [Microbacterium dauci]|uniref:DUF3263 domain-containing protein n=1 Tax=Microbacterium dauci TaxID=3048008 RepID=A0ABT6ZAA1_9MICO|nr:DUF3263 domain-containing protein [Microbacterium sp. LX3-4]MDJ1113084.1 DUF3263 domain-containing protein [Microbacterium sp. LX3-4]